MDLLRRHLGVYATKLYPEMDNHAVVSVVVTRLQQTVFVNVLQGLKHKILLLHAYAIKNSRLTDHHVEQPAKHTNKQWMESSASALTDSLH